MADFAPGLVTVFGGSGFIGTQVVRALARRGWRIRVAVRSSISAKPCATPASSGKRRSSAPQKA